jgi:hypothetical protein
MMRRLLMMFAKAAMCALAASAWCTSAPAQPGMPPAAPAAPAAAPGAPSADDALQPSTRDDKETVEASRAWLALLDAGNFGAAWDGASPHLKSVVTRQKWITGLTAARKPFGKLKQRTPVKFARSHSMPDAPDGDYSLLEFESEFANGKRASEQIIWMLGDNQVWRVSGYYIR